jgi:hypothetical protein
MNTDIICIPYLQKDCRSAGREIEQRVLDGETLTDKVLDTTFQPVIDTVIEKTQTAVEKEHDETLAQLEDKKEQALRENQLFTKRASISDSVRVTVNDNMSAPGDYEDLGPHKYLPGCLDLDIDSPNEDIDCVSDSELLDYDTDDDHWDEYRKTLNIDIDNEFVPFLFVRSEQFVDLIKKHHYTYAQSVHILDTLADRGYLDKWSVKQLRVLFTLKFESEPEHSCRKCGFVEHHKSKRRKISSD